MVCANAQASDSHNAFLGSRRSFCLSFPLCSRSDRGSFFGGGFEGSSFLCCLFLAGSFFGSRLDTSCPVSSRFGRGSFLSFGLLSSRFGGRFLLISIG